MQQDKISRMSKRFSVHHACMTNVDVPTGQTQGGSPYPSLDLRHVNSIGSHWSLHAYLLRHFTLSPTLLQEYGWQSWGVHKCLTLVGLGAFILFRAEILSSKATQIELWMSKRLASEIRAIETSKNGKAIGSTVEHLQLSNAVEIGLILGG